MAVPEGDGINALWALLAESANALRQAGGPSADAKYNPTVRELLDRAAAELAPDKIEAQFPKQPLVQAEILQTIGNTYRGIGEYTPANTATLWESPSEPRK